MPNDALFFFSIFTYPELLTTWFVVAYSCTWMFVIFGCVVVYILFPRTSSASCGQGVSVTRNDFKTTYFYFCFTFACIKLSSFLPVTTFPHLDHEVSLVYFYFQCHYQLFLCMNSWDEKSFLFTLFISGQLSSSLLFEYTDRYTPKEDRRTQWQNCCD